MRNHSPCEYPLIGCSLNSTFLNSDMSAFRIEVEILYLSEQVKPTLASNWLPLIDINESLIGNSVDLYQYIPIPEDKNMILIKFYSKVNDGIKMRGWTYFYISKDAEIQNGRWKIPFYLPPVVKVVKEENNRQIWEFANVYISVGDFTCPDMIEAYSEHIQHVSKLQKL